MLSPCLHHPLANLFPLFHAYLPLGITNPKGP
jgi:hypothetical protein